MEKVKLEIDGGTTLQPWRAWQTRCPAPPKSPSAFGRRPCRGEACFPNAGLDSGSRLIKSSMSKRRFEDVDENVPNGTPKRPRMNNLGAVETPSKGRSILKRTQSNPDGEETPRSARRVLFTTPTTARELRDLDGPPESPLTAASNADRSARRKSARKLFERQELDEDGEEVEAEEDALAQAILDQEEEDILDTIAVVPKDPVQGQDQDQDQDRDQDQDAELRGRPKGRRRARSPTPPQDLPSHELFFFQNRPGASSKTSSNTLPSALLLNHEDYFANISAYKDPHDADKEHLKDLHSRGFDQWVFELQEGFNICLYGYGSKRELVLDFAEHLCDVSAELPKVVVVNGYTPTMTLKDILTTLANTVLPRSHSIKLPAQPAALLDLLMAALTVAPLPQPLYFIINSIDAAPLRKAPTQTTLARLASHPSIALIATADTPNFPLMWDISQRTQYRFLFHDTTTFAPYTAELPVVDDVNALLGRSGRRVGGKDGVGYVLRSLPENARALFRILVAEQLALADADGGYGAMGHDDDGDASDEEMLLLGSEGYDADDMDVEASDTPSRVRRGRPAKKAAAKRRTKEAAVLRARSAMPEGVEYRTLYHKAVEEFVCSSEMGFRTLLKEFHDHQMVESRKDAAGTERLSVPFAREELEGLLEELV